MLKRWFDITFALVALLLLAPWLVLVALLIMRETRAPAIEASWRVGRGGRQFRMLRFRAPASTWLGRLLHGWPAHLPLLLNVLKGDMSLVGPWPARPAELRRIHTHGRTLLSVRPGMLGPAQLTLGAGTAWGVPALGERDYAERVLPVRLQLDQYYVCQRSPLLDMQLLVMAALLPFAQRQIRLDPRRVPVVRG